MRRDKTFGREEGTVDGAGTSTFRVKRMSGDRTGILKHIDKERANAIKLMLAASFGYLGYRNSKFGRVETYNI